MKNKISTLITVSNSIFIIVLAVFWWTQKNKSWTQIKSASKTVIISCGQKQLVYTNSQNREERVEIAVTNNCSADVSGWVAKEDVIKAGTLISVPSHQTTRSVYELQKGESLVAEVRQSADSSGEPSKLAYRVVAIKQ